LAGRDVGDVFDRLADAAQGLGYGEDGVGKFMSLTQAQIRHVAERRPRDVAALGRIIGEAKAERFGAAFLRVLRDG
jgi:ATP-dependent DNA helicase RecQ